MQRAYFEELCGSPVAPSFLESKVIEAIADWCDALHGDLSLKDAFGALANGLGASAGMLVRTHLSDLRPIRIAVWDQLDTRSCLPLRVSYADGYFGRHLARPRPASVWLASAHDSEGDADPALETWQARRGMVDFAVLVLGSGPTTRDHIELHFGGRVSEAMQSSLSVILPTMSRTWASRQVGLVTRTVVNHRAAQDTGQVQPGQRALLGATNPARLSRAEFRVCLLLSRGLSAMGVANELAVSESTVRSHLRSIYAKTETSGLAELVVNLLRTKLEASAMSELRCA
ncbi:LuxR family transcriptional regulator [Pseudotabrizicola sediminis]|uniref:LuxR family transcriptional regulator n=1 Tax=Pseudotabrizicola sediminis TaxID=2486418 RepID=A0ABY2KVM5_9RHOB|nr:helix-turn-helix transcriptional regulator [Pseudotabrizicola sediminis]TGD45332.1 LuxR family transcriptional regulator [Pseudotabrizicola sediminis]